MYSMRQSYVLSIDIDGIDGHLFDSSLLPQKNCCKLSFVVYWAGLRCLYVVYCSTGVVVDDFAIICRMPEKSPMIYIKE